MISIMLDHEVQTTRDKDGLEDIESFIEAAPVAGNQ